jgi:hypothetical protein
VNGGEMALLAFLGSYAGQQGDFIKGGIAMNWDYKVVYIDATGWTWSGLPNDVNEQFDKWGAMGWEFVRTEPIIRRGWTGTYTAGILAFFKRQIT